MGPSIIASLMVEYYYDQDGYWYELLHEIIHGRKMGAYMIHRRDSLFYICRDFFNGGDYTQAPKYIPNEWDELFLNRRIGPQVWDYFRQRGP